MSTTEQDIFGSEEVTEYPDYIKKWKCHCVPVGRPLRGVIAGPMIVRTCHYYRRKWVGCSKTITDGKVPCMCGHSHYDTRKFGYVPFYDDKGNRWVVKIPEKLTVEVKQISRLHGVMFTKVRLEKHSEMQVKYGTLVDMDLRHMINRCSWPDEHIGRYLIHLWQREDLAKHFKLPFFPAKSVQSRLYNEETDRLEDLRLEKQVQKALEEKKRKELGELT